MDESRSIADVESRLKEAKDWWIQDVVKLVSDDIYEPAVYKGSCNQLCFDLLNFMSVRNGNRLPVDHTVLSVSRLCANSEPEGKYFTGKFGERSGPLPNSVELAGFNALEERPVILLGFLTTDPSCDKILHPDAGMFYLEDKHSAIICQVSEECQPEKSLLNNLVVLQKWNFIEAKFPYMIYESHKMKKTDKLKYIEVVENILCLEKHEPEVIPKAVSPEEYSKMEMLPNKDRINVIGCLKTLSSTHATCESEPYFFAQLYSMDKKHSISICFPGCKFAAWYYLMKIEETYIISGLRKTTMNKGQPSERVLLAATKRSDILKVVSPTSTELEISLQESIVKTPQVSRENKRKYDEIVEEQEGLSKRCEERQKCSGASKPVMPNSREYLCSDPIEYQGVITAIVNSEVGLYEIDHRFRLFTHYLQNQNFGCGMRIGALVTLYHIHLCKMGEKVLGFVCCNTSTVRINKNSELDSPFQFRDIGGNYITQSFHRLSLLDFIKVLDICELLMKKFQSKLNTTDIIGSHKSHKRTKPTVLSHVIDQGRVTSLPSRDLYDEFFSKPHRCIVTTPPDRVPIPTPLALKDLLNLVDELWSQRNEQQSSSVKTAQYEWNYTEISQKDLPEDLVLLGWLRQRKKDGKMYLCDATSSVLCLIVDNKWSKSPHECDDKCLRKRNGTGMVIFPFTRQEKPSCPLLKASYLGAVLKLTSFKIVIESFSGKEILNDDEANPSNDLSRKIYLVFSICDAIVIGKFPGYDSSVVCKKRQVQEFATDGEKTELEKDTGCKFIFFVEHKDSGAVQIENNIASLGAYVHGYILWKCNTTFTCQRDRHRHTGSRSVNEESDLQGTLKDIREQGLVMEFTSCSYWLNFLHQGRLYYVIEHHVNNKCIMEHALQGRTRVVRVSSNFKFEEIDDVGRSRCAEQCEHLLKFCRKVKNVRSYLSRWENKSDVSENGLVSLRGIVLSRGVVTSNNDVCAFPPIPNDRIHLPGCGLISRSNASALSLGCCYLSNRKVVLTVRDVLTADCVKVYLDLSSRSYPLALLPGAVVTFRNLQHHLSKQGNIYLSFEACSSITVDALPTTGILPPTLSETPSKLNSQIDTRQIGDYFDVERCWKFSHILSHVLCRITAVQNISLKWTCAKCDQVPSICCCHVSATNPACVVFSARARCLAEDGTGEAMLFIDDDELVKCMLLSQDSAWREIKDMSRKNEEVCFNRFSFWKDDQAVGVNKVAQILSCMATSQKLRRTVKILCKQFKMDLVEKVESRNIRVDGNEHTTNVASKITLNVLAIDEIDYKNELKTLISSAS